MQDKNKQGQNAPNNEIIEFITLLGGSAIEMNAERQALKNKAEQEKPLIILKFDDPGFEDFTKQLATLRLRNRKEYEALKRRVAALVE